MPHMKVQVDEDFFVIAETKAGTFAFPAELIGVEEERDLEEDELADCKPYLESEAIEARVSFGWFARLSAPGYLDATEWSGPFDSEEDARDHMEDMYGDELPRSPGRLQGQRPAQRALQRQAGEGSGVVDVRRPSSSRWADHRQAGAELGQPILQVSPT